MPRHSRDEEEQNAPRSSNLTPNNPDSEIVGRLDDSTPPAANPPAPHRPAPGVPSGTGNPLGDLLGSLMGGAGAPGNAQAGGDPLGGLLGSLLGGGGSQAGGESPLGGLLGGLFGGGASGTMSNTGAGIGQSPLAGLVAPLAEQLSARFKLPPEIAQAVVVFAITKLTESMTNRGNVPSTGGRGQSVSARDLFDRMNSGQGVDNQYLVNSGLAGELAQQSGMDEHTAAATLEHVLGGLGSQLKSG